MKIGESPCPAEMHALKPTNTCMLSIQMTFFTKMATLNVLTISLSFCFSLFFFMPLCLLLGGEGDTGSISCSKKGGNKGKEQDGHVVSSPPLLVVAGNPPRSQLAQTLA